MKSVVSNHIAPPAFTACQPGGWAVVQGCMLLCHSNTMRPTEKGLPSIHHPVLATFFPCLREEEYMIHLDELATYPFLKF